MKVESSNGTYTKRISPFTALNITLQQTPFVH